MKIDFWLLFAPLMILTVELGTQNKIAICSINCSFAFPFCAVWESLTSMRFRQWLYPLGMHVYLEPGFTSRSIIIPSLTSFNAFMKGIDIKISKHCIAVTRVYVCMQIMLWPGALTPGAHPLECPQSFPVSLVTGAFRIIFCSALWLTMHSLNGSAMFLCKDLKMRIYRIGIYLYQYYV